MAQFRTNLRCAVITGGESGLWFWSERLWCNRANPGCPAYVFGPDLFACGRCREKCSQLRVGETDENGLHQVELTCPGCGAVNEIRCSQRLLRYLWEQRALQEQALKESIRRLVPDSPSDAQLIERWADALSCGLIDPGDL